MHDLAKVRAYIRRFSPRAADRLVLKLVDATLALAEHPERGRPIPRDKRELTIILPYIIRYRIIDEVVWITASGTCRADPSGKPTKQKAPDRSGAFRILVAVSDDYSSSPPA